MKHFVAWIVYMIGVFVPQQIIMQRFHVVSNTDGSLMILMCCGLAVALGMLGGVIQS